MGLKRSVKVTPSSPMSILAKKWNVSRTTNSKACQELGGLLGVTPGAIRGKKDSQALMTSAAETLAHSLEMEALRASRLLWWVLHTWPSNSPDREPPGLLLLGRVREAGCRSARPTTTVLKPSRPPSPGSGPRSPPRTSPQTARPFAPDQGHAGR